MTLVDQLRELSRQLEGGSQKYNRKICVESAKELTRQQAEIASLKARVKEWEIYQQENP